MKTRTSTMKGIIFCVMLSTALLGCATQVKFQRSSITPAAKASAQVDRDDNDNITLRVQVEHLASPDSLDPPAAVYVVWAETRDGTLANLGRLLVNDDLEGNLTAVTPYKQIKLRITGEQESSVESPSNQVILETGFFDAAKMTK